MSGKKLTFTIGGREALPVRAIPYIAEWKEENASPKCMAWIAWIADYLAQGKKAPRGATPLTAYKWLKDKSPVTVSPSDWKLTVESLGVRVASLRTQANELPTPTTSFIDARKLEVLVEELPRGAFVWFEEFELTYRNSRERHPSGSFILNLTPMACDDFNTRALVLFGFEEHEHYSNNQQKEAIKREGMVAWSNAPKNAAMWLKRDRVKPDKAAMLLCGIDPLERDWRGNAPDPERIYVDGDKAWPDRYRLMLDVFLEVAETDPTPRTLLVWRDVAKGQGLRYHEWIDEHVQAQIEELPADAGGKGDVEKVGAGEMALRGVSLQDVISNDWPIKEAPRFTQGSFKNALSDVPKWLEPAIVGRGKPGRSSNVWNPAMIACCLKAKGASGIGALTAHIRNHFPDWLAEWEEIKDR